MFTKRNVHFVLMTLASALAVATTLNFMLQAFVNIQMLNLQDAYFVLSMLLLPFGAALWIAPSVRTALEGTCLGLIVGLGFVVYILVLGDTAQAFAMRQYFILHAHIIDFGFMAFAFVIMASLCGFTSGWGMFHLGEYLRRSRQRARASRLRR